jgi:hypothetical protein
MTAVPDMEVATEPPRHPDRPAWRLDWLTPARCRILLALVLLLDVLGHVHYLNDNCPIDLVGDEAQYWDWSRRLDWSYYSKGPLVAYIIRASCAVFGDTMQGVRYPAIAFGVATSIVTYLLTKKLFGSERLALGAVLLNHIVPMFIAGSVLMTIDPPMFFCWALATLLAAAAIFEGKRWAWPVAGLVIGIGFLAKYAALVWFGGVLVFMLIDPQSRPMLKTRWPWIAFGVALLCTIPVIVWNHQHHWVSFRHVATQTGASGGTIRKGNFFEFLGSQIAVVGPVLAVMTIVAVRYTFSRTYGAADPNRRKLLYLATIGMLFFVSVAVISFFAKVQVNWPAPAYFTLMIVTAYYVATRLRGTQTWRAWRAWFWGTVALGLVTIPIAHDSSVLFPAVNRINATLGTKFNPANVDVLMRLRGWRMLGEHVGAQLQDLGPGAFVLCDDYQQTAEMAFYVPGQPKTYCAGSYYADAKRHTQYDIWPDRRLDDPELIGRNAVFVGKGGSPPPDIATAFERVERLPEVPVVVRGVTLKTFKTWRGYGFRGMTRGDRGGTAGGESF